MNDYFTKFEAELRAAASRLAPADRPRMHSAWRPRGLLLVGIALVLVAVPAVAAVTGAFDGTRAPNLAPGDSASLTPPCQGPSPPPPKPIHGQAPAAMTQLLATLRRPQRAADRLAPNRLPHSGALLVDAARLAYTGADGTKYFLIPSTDVRYGPPLPNTPACATYRRAMRHAPQAGVCLWRTGGVLAGGGCATLDQLRVGATGPEQSYGQGMAAGTMYVSGIAADGVRSILLRYPKRAPVRQVTIPVRANVYAAVIRGRPELAPAAYAQGPGGSRLVQRGQEPPSPRQHGLNERSAARDLSATSTPTVMPPVGYPHTTFTFRVRLKPLRHQVYVVRVSGPPGLCHETVKPFAINPAPSGPLRGLIKLGIGYGPLGLHKMCLGSYRGVVTRVPAGARIANGVVVKRFGFEVRRRPSGG
jgi:hypothetical protein